MMRIKQISLVLLVFLAPVVQACGPWLPEAYVLRNDDVFYAPPEVGFGAELRHLLSDSIPHVAQLDGEALGSQSSVDELHAALKRRGDTTEEILANVRSYTEFRADLNRIKPYLEVAPFDYYSSGVDEAQRELSLQRLSALEVPTALPAEYRLYLAGALAYYRADHDAALQNWKAVLALPAAERHDRSVMAAFMIAKACQQAELEYFPLVRQLVSDGYGDQQGLAAASYGREARAYLDRRQYPQAIDLYLKQWATGYSNAEQSLYIVARDIWRYSYGAQLQSLVEDEQSRALLTAYLLTQYEDSQTADLRERFLQALPDVKQITVAEAGRFALMEYQRNNLTSAYLWISYAAAEDALALWVKSKLLLRAGKIEEGRTLMLVLTAEMSAKGEDWRRLDTSRAWGELGLLMLREKRYLAATDAFWNSGSWGDCAYVLERLLSTEELIEWCEAHPIPEDLTLENFDGSGPQALLARRLMREARFEEALSYLDAQTVLRAEAYIAAMRIAGDSSQSVATRARHYWAAARITRDHGMSLFGSEHSPDYAWTGGQYDWGDLFQERKDQMYTAGHRINELSWDEMKLAQQTQVLPNQRFHYRYRAVQLAELAAGLLPNNDEQAARIYCVAGSWIKFRDPSTADRLYKQLVVRCPETELGKQASVVNWFPQLEVDTIEPFSNVADE
ncbi:hypothetical protein ACWPKO_15560 [Coraliomargarita sp. W4R53]